MIKRRIEKREVVGGALIPSKTTARSSVRTPREWVYLAVSNFQILQILGSTPSSHACAVSLVPLSSVVSSKIKAQKKKPAKKRREGERRRHTPLISPCSSRRLHLLQHFLVLLAVVASKLKKKKRRGSRGEVNKGYSTC